MRKTRLNTARVTLGRLWRAGWMPALCVALMASCALAQQAPPKKAPTNSTKQRSPKAANNSEKPKATGKAQTTSKTKVAGKEKKKAGSKGCGASKPKKKGAHLPIVPNPDAKWSCDKKTVDVGDVWADNSMEFVFTIKNEGTADLRFKARGG